MAPGGVASRAATPLSLIAAFPKIELRRAIELNCSAAACLLAPSRSGCRRCHARYGTPISTLTTRYSRMVPSKRWPGKFATAIVSALAGWRQALETRADGLFRIRPVQELPGESSRGDEDDNRYDAGLSLGGPNGAPAFRRKTSAASWQQDLRDRAVNFTSRSACPGSRARTVIPATSARITVITATARWRRAPSRTIDRRRIRSTPWPGGTDHDRQQRQKGHEAERVGSLSSGLALFNRQERRARASATWPLTRFPASL